MNVLEPRRRILAGEPMGVVELPILILSGLIDDTSRTALKNRHIRMDRSVGAYLLVANGLLWGMRGTEDLQTLVQGYKDASGNNPDMVVVGPAIEHQGYSYAILLPKEAVEGFLVDRWVPGIGRGPASL